MFSVVSGNANLICAILAPVNKKSCRWEEKCMVTVTIPACRPFDYERRKHAIFSIVVASEDFNPDDAVPSPTISRTLGQYGTLDHNRTSGRVEKIRRLMDRFAAPMGARKSVHESSSQITLSMIRKRRIVEALVMNSINATGCAAGKSETPTAGKCRAQIKPSRTSRRSDRILDDDVEVLPNWLWRFMLFS